MATSDRGANDAISARLDGLDRVLAARLDAMSGHLDAIDRRTLDMSASMTRVKEDISSVKTDVGNIKDQLEKKANQSDLENLKTTVDGKADASSLETTKNYNKALFGALIASLIALVTDQWKQWF